MKIILKALLVLFLFCGVVDAKYSIYGTTWEYSYCNEVSFDFFGTKINGERSFFWWLFLPEGKATSFFFLHPQIPYILWGIAFNESGYGIIIDLSMPKVLERQ